MSHRLFTRLLKLSPLLLIFSVLPLMVCYIPFNMPAFFEELYMSDSYSSTFFLIKVFGYILITLYMLIILIVFKKNLILHRTPVFNICYAMSGIFILCTLLSSYFSPYQSATILGAPSRLEGTLVIVCYFLTFLVAYISIQDHTDIMPIFYTFMILSIIQVFVGITQFIGYDILSWGGLRQFTSPLFASGNYYSTTTPPFFLATHPKSWTGTIGNSNYSGSFVALGLPLLTLLYFCIQNRKIKILCMIAVLSQLTIAFLCGSRAGMIGLFTSTIILLILTYKFLPTAWAHVQSRFTKKPLRSCLSLIGFGSYLFFLATISNTSNDFNRMFHDLEQVMQGSSTPVPLPPPTIPLIHPYTNEPVALEPVRSFGFTGLERIGSGRGYIWSRSIPLLTDTLLLGYGTDAFVLAYPQHDFSGKLTFLSNPWIVVDKPHNTYLQFWINHGFIAFLCFLILNLTYIVQSLRLFGFNTVYTSREGIGLALMLSIIAYLVSSMFNDTTISVTPMYFALLGIGVSYNRIYHSLQHN